MGLFDKLFRPKTQTIEQEEMLSDEQKQMQKLLADYASTGKWGDTGFQAGEAYPEIDELADVYETTDIEDVSQGKLLDMIGSSMPDIWEQGKGEISDLLSTDKYDPYAKGGVYGGFEREVLKASDEAQDRLKQNQAVLGSLRSRATTEAMSGLEEETHATLSNKLAELYQDYANKRISGAKTAGEMGVLEQSMEQDKIKLAQEYGGLQRTLAEARAKTKFAEWSRQREDWTSTMDAAKNVWGRNVDYGMKSFSKERPSTFMGMLGEISPTVGSYNTHKYGYTTNQGSLASEKGRIQDFVGDFFSGSGSSGGGGAIMSMLSSNRFKKNIRSWN